MWSNAIVEQKTAREALEEVSRAGAFRSMAYAMNSENVG